VAHFLLHVWPHFCSCESPRTERSDIRGKQGNGCRRCLEKGMDENHSNFVEKGAQVYTRRDDWPGSFVQMPWGIRERGDECRFGAPCY